MASSMKLLPRSGDYNYAKKKLSADYDSPLRTATAKSAVFNLVSTIIGGGVLSLPFSFDKCGIIFGVIFMIISAIASDFTVYILVSCSRRSSAQSFEAVARRAFGQKAQLFTMLLLFLLTYLVFAAYVILTRDLASPLVEEYIVGATLTIGQKNTIATFCVLLISPVLCFRSMHSLRFSSIVSLLSVLILAIAISVRAFEMVHSGSFIWDKVKFMPSNWHDPVYAFPIISIAYLCHFNVLPVYGELHRPTRRRLKKIVHSTMSSTAFFYLVVGLMGYLYASQTDGGVKDDILNNFGNFDWLINLGRLGLTITVLLSLPLLLLPCRDTVYRVFMLVAYSVRPGNEEQIHLLVSPALNRDEQPKASLLTHLVLTFTIAGSALILAFAVPGVAVVWSLVGSTVGLMISYVLPCACYIKIRHQKPHSDIRKLTAWIILCLSIIACVFCTCQSISQLL